MAAPQKHLYAVMVVGDRLPKLAPSTAIGQQRYGVHIRSMAVQPSAIVRATCKPSIEIRLDESVRVEHLMSGGRPSLEPPGMLAALAEMERDLLLERTAAGLARAKSEGKTLGRPAKTTPEQRADIIAKYAAGESVSALARMYDVSRANILGVVKPA
ncbi:recombinase family protein [Duganella callida]|uniref:recombinase family protein n=1 Tax=Duganella callida TaxID=2561932 RepID=UPI001E30EFE5|nr:recombinase family protein [Duganella callida]